MKKIIKRTTGSFLLVIIAQIALACPVCERQQPKALRGITHGVGPEDKLDYLIITLAILIVLLTLYFSVRYLVSPGERSDDHIKRLILK